MMNNNMMGMGMGRGAGMMSGQMIPQMGMQGMPNAMATNLQGISTPRWLVCSALSTTF